MTFSAFDPFEPLSNKESHKISYAYIGLKRSPDEKDEDDRPKKSSKAADDFSKDFARSVAKCRAGLRAVRWRRALETLESDPLFEESNVTGLAEGDDDDLEHRTGWIGTKIEYLRR